MVEKEQNVSVKKKVLFFINSFQIGGAHLQMTYLIKELKNEHYEPIICTHISDDGGLKDLYYSLGVKIYNLSRKHPLDFSILPRLKDILVEESIDIIILLLPQNFIYYRLVKRLVKRKIYQVGLLRAMGFWLGHKNAFLKIIDNIVAAKFVRSSDLVFANSKAIKNRYDKRFNLSKNKIKVAYNTSEFKFNITKSRTEIRNELNVLEGEVLVIMVARLDPWKDFDTILNAAKEVNEQTKEIKFVLCGGGQLENEIRKKIEALRLEDTIALIGEKKNAAEYINAADISVLTTKGEGFSNVIMESMALSKPVIASDVGGNSELIGRDSHCGYLINPFDYKGLAQHIFALSKDKELANSVGVKAQKRIFALCDPKNIQAIINDLASLTEKPLV